MQAGHGQLRVRVTYLVWFRRRDLSLQLLDKCVSNRLTNFISLVCRKGEPFKIDRVEDKLPRLLNGWIRRDGIHDKRLIISSLEIKVVL